MACNTMDDGPPFPNDLFDEVVDDHLFFDYNPIDAPVESTEG